MDHVHAEQQRNAEAWLFHSLFLYLTYFLHPFQVEQSSHFAFLDFAGDVAALGLSGSNLSRDGKVQLTDLFFGGHFFHQCVDETIHVLWRLLSGCGQESCRKEQD